MKKINHTIFNGLAIAVTSYLIYLVVGNGTADGKSVLSLITGIMMNVALFLGIGFGLQFFQMGIGRNVQEEVFDKDNIAVAIYQAGLFIALAIIIAKGIL